MAFKGTHNVESHGTKAWRQRLKVSPKQRVAAGTILVMNVKTLKPGENTYSGNNNIHSRIDGFVEIKNQKININPKPSKK